MAGPQHVYEALKRAREEGEAWVTWTGLRMRLVPLSTMEDHRGIEVPAAEGDRLNMTIFHAIVKSRRPGGIAFAWVDAYKDVGDRIRIWEGGEYSQQGEGPTRMGGWDQVLAVVTEHHKR